jgi:hypothetical protein
VALVEKTHSPELHTISLQVHSMSDMDAGFRTRHNLNSHTHSLN